MTMFTVISFSMCAYLFQIHQFNDPRTVVVIGNIANGVCDPFAFFPDTGGERVMLGAHEYGADVDNNGATLYFDSKIFHLVKDSI